MPEIIVTAVTPDRSSEEVMLRERVTVDDFESAHFASQLVERLGWAVDDAHAAEVSQRVESEATRAPRAPRAASSRR